MTTRSFDYGDPSKTEKGTYPSDHSVGEGNVEGTDRKFSVNTKSRHGSISEAAIAADLLDERYMQTQRGLKSRHAQMIALGG